MMGHIYSDFHHTLLLITFKIGTSFWQDTLDNKNGACADFISRLNKSLAVWGNKLSVEARY